MSNRGISALLNCGVTQPGLHKLVCLRCSSAPLYVNVLAIIILQPSEVNQTAVFSTTMNDDLTTVKPLDPVAAAGVSSADAVTSGITLLSEGSNIKYYGSTSADAETSIFSGEIVSQVKTDEKYRRRQLVNFTTLCWTFILEGWNDGSLGPLIPRIQQHYGVRCSY